MKKITVYILAALACVALATGCDEADGDRDYGYPYVLMPQAQRLDEYYRVPSGDAEWTYNFRVEDGKLLVYLGVLRSGKVKDEAFSVSIVMNDTRAQNFVNKTAGAVMMPGTIYTLPSTVSVAKGSDQASFYLEVDAAALSSGTYAGEQLVLCVELANPTRYELSREAASTMVVVDVDAIQSFL